MKKVLYLTFYFEPDLCAGSFRNTSLAYELARQLEGIAEVDLYTTMPNRYNSFKQKAKKTETKNNLTIHRINIPNHKSGILDQINSFKTFYVQVKKQTKKKDYDLVFASSSRLFTAYLGYTVAKRQKQKLYLDIRDIFYDSLKDLIRVKPLRMFMFPIIKKIETVTFSNATHINLISGGFISYFEKYKSIKTVYPNGIDKEFIKDNVNNKEKIQDEDKKDFDVEKRRVVYAGNIGEGQGLHKLVPELAKKFTGKLEFHIIGDGGAKKKLINRIRKLGCNNVLLRDPLSRQQLLNEYEKADYYLIHLNDFKAFKKVLPSKIFELGAYNKPIIAGVSGFAAKFIEENLSNVILFHPCDVDECYNKLKNYSYQRIERADFIERYRRDHINKKMAASIISYL